MPVGSMPYLMRRGVLVATLRSSLRTSSASGTSWSVPRRIRANCSATLFTATSLLSLRQDRQSRRLSLRIHLKSAHGLKGLTEVVDVRFALSRRPGHRQHVEAGRALEQTIPAQIVERHLRQSGLLGIVHRGGGPLGVVAAGG